MPSKHLRAHSSTLRGCLRFLPLLAGVLALGCGSGDQIERYTVPNPPQVEDRMLGAIIPSESQLVFFKVAGPDSLVAAQHDSFLELVKSVRFRGARPIWDLPEGWTEEIGSGMRLATIQVPTSTVPLELSVIPLGRGEEPLEEQILANVNRWRGQLQLSPVAAEDLKTTSPQWTQVEAGDQMATVINFVGKLKASSQPPFAPFAGGKTPAGPPTGGPPAQRPPASADFAFDTPEGWEAGRTSSMRKAAFVVQDGGKQVEITVITLSPNQNVLANVNRWRGQVGLQAIDENQLEVADIEVDELTGKYVQIYGPQESILGVLIERGDQSWSLRMKGATELSRRERENFEKFARSLRWK